MAKKKQKKKKKMPEQAPRPKDFLDMIAPAAVKFNTDHFILGSRYHTAMALKSYPPMTDELALLRGLGDMGGVNLRLTARQVTPAEEDAILHAATNKSRMERSNTNDYKQSVTAEANLRDMAELLAKQRQEKEPLIHCGVYLDIAAADTEKLRTARDTVSAQLVRSRMGADPLLLRQREGFLSANPAGGSQLANFAERVLPARSVANLYPMNYSGKTDPKGFFIGRDRFGSNIIVDFDRRASDKTNASALILGNTGQGKSYLLKLLLCNVREAGKSVISLDSEHEMEDECRALGGCFLDYLSGQYRINLLEPRCWDDGSGPEDPDAPDAFRGTLLSQHISFLRDVFRVYKGFDTPHIDTLELMVEILYKKWNITDHTDFASVEPVFAAEETQQVVDTRPGEVARHGNILDAPHRQVHAARTGDVAQQFREGQASRRDVDRACERRVAFHERLQLAVDTGKADRIGILRSTAQGKEQKQQVKVFHRLIVQQGYQLLERSFAPQQKPDNGIAQRGDAPGRQQGADVGMAAAGRCREFVVHGDHLVHRTPAAVTRIKTPLATNRFVIPGGGMSGKQPPHLAGHRCLPLAVRAQQAHEPLGNGHHQRIGHQVGVHPHVGKACHGTPGRIGMDRGKQKVPRQRRAHGHLSRRAVADLAQHDDVGILPQERPQRTGER